MNRFSRAKNVSASCVAALGFSVLVMGQSAATAQSMGGIFGRPSNQGSANQSRRQDVQPQPSFPAQERTSAPERETNPIFLPDPVQQSEPIRQVFPTPEPDPVRQTSPVRHVDSNSTQISRVPDPQPIINSVPSVVPAPIRTINPPAFGTQRLQVPSSPAQSSNHSDSVRSGILRYENDNGVRHDSRTFDGAGRSAAPTRSQVNRGPQTYSNRPVFTAAPVHSQSGVGPQYNGGNGFDPIRITTPVGQRPLPIRRNPDYFYDPGNSIGFYGGPTLLGGYYYSDYCDSGNYQYSYPSVYSVYSGFPQYIYNPNVVILAQPYFPVYVTDWLPYYQPSIQVTYNQTNYYVSNEKRANQLSEGGKAAREALKFAYPEGSFQAAFADIAKAWNSNDYSLIKSHVKPDNTKITISLNKKYGYSINGSDYRSITKDAVEKLNTKSFVFTRLRKAKNGDITAYGKHIYSLGTGDDVSTTSSSDDTVPFNQPDQNDPYSDSPDPQNSDVSSVDHDKTVYVSYTLRHTGDNWFIVAVDSSKQPLVNKN